VSSSQVVGRWSSATRGRVRDDAGPGSEAPPSALVVSVPGGPAVDVRGFEGREDALVRERDREEDLRGPEDVRLGPVGLGAEPFDEPGGLLRFGVADHAHADVVLLLEAIEHRAGDVLVGGDVDDHLLGGLTAAAGEGEQRDCAGREPSAEGPLGANRHGQSSSPAAGSVEDGSAASLEPLSDDGPVGGASSSARRRAAHCFICPK